MCVVPLCVCFQYHSCIANTVAQHNANAVWIGFCDGMDFDHLLMLTVVLRCFSALNYFNDRTKHD